MRKALLAFALIISTAYCMSQPKQETNALSALVEAERSFARTSLEIGARPAFMKFFADDAVVFRPGPVRYKEAMKDVPVSKNPRETSLEWEPLYADISSAGDMGYTTGPSLWTDHSDAKRPPYYGYYFSVWKKQPSGEWKVAIDVGTEQPGPFIGSRVFHAPAPVERNQPVPVSGPDENVVGLMNVEREFLEAVQKDGAVKALAKYAAKETRVYRETEIPIVGSESLPGRFSARPYLSQWNPMFCDVARSGDLGYVYGGYMVAAPKDTQTPPESGFYLRVWKRDETNAWRFVVEVTSPVPPPPPPPK